MTTKERLTNISFDFDSYDFWYSWDDEDLANVDQSASMEKYFTTLASRTAKAFGAEHWEADWSRQSGTGHKAYCDVISDDRTAYLSFQDEIESELQNSGLDQDDWLVMEG